MAVKLTDAPGSVFVTYIATTPEKLWEALTSAEFSRQYFFGRAITVEPNVGGTFALLMDDGKVDSGGRVLVYDKPKRFAVTWRVEWLPDFRDLPEGIVIFDLAPSGETVRLTVSEIHDPALPEMFKQGGRSGWPVILSGLKSLLETGRVPKIEMPKPPTQ
jgi:uncharacterized protein YndB with AHSA1/START domain